ncbi:hypothetical protein CLPU_1c00610 [Gottschalkia purinilytica]|uniref:Putative Se/S carrier protein-like domain-containing protein n=1 Tax=Gottschalkia purinilytica TaxID=1503 RepID=A0A0L0WEM9_GOTPU|nr:DUF3343 domain-containing protein [Gottschalkia purinilytica]KNF09896.1 hypothetical protein CLPU_1c00610 [Gottschalkia purinilytica]
MKSKTLSNREYFIAVFRSKNHAIQIFYNLEKKGYTFFQLISTPCQLKGGCSYSIKFNRLNDIEYIRRLHGDLSSCLSGVYHVAKINGKKVLTEVKNVI